MNKHIIYRILCACLLLLLHLVPAPTAHAAFPVTSTADSGPGSLRQAIINANATPELDVIEFGLSGCPCTITLQTALPEIVYPLEIYGLLSADQVTISGNNAVRVFKVASTGSLSLWRVTVASGLSAGGSAIHNSGSVDIHDSVFSNNSVTGDWSVGGAIYNRGSMNISNSMFSGNRSPTTNDGKGGAIFNHDEGTLTLSGSNFTSNSAGQDGGAIYNGGEMTATNGTFSGNTAYYDGGAIYNIARSIDIVDCTFSGNHASAGKGGAIYNWSGYHGGSASVTITNTTFSNNTASERGGAIDNYVYDGTARVTITDSTFSQNSSWKGGAISNHRYTTLGARVDIADSTFSNNRAVGGGDGGAIHNAGDEVTVSRSVFSGNRTEGWGGAISSSGTLRIDQSSFINNVVLVEAIGYAGGGGAAISNLGGNATVTNSTFSGNTSDSRGCIYNQDGSLKVTDSTFSGNNADGEGGAINNYRFTSTTNATVTNCTLSANGARQGGNLYNFNGTLTLRNSIVANSTRGGNCSGTVTDGGGNLRWPASDTSCVGTYGDPKLSPLADNGGPTETMALQSGSMAVGAGDDAICALTPPDGPGGKDQRGVAHVEVCDAGAYESPYHKSTVSITSDAPDPSVVGQQAEVGFSVAAFYQGQPTPTGSVTVRDGTVSCVGQLSNDGTGSCTVALALVGARTLTATYSGDDVFNGGSDTEPHQVDRADTTTVISSHLPNPSIMGQPVQVNVAVSANLPGSGTPGSSVLVAVLGEAFCWATLTNGAGNCSLTFASPGTKSITANYGGDANFNGSASAPVSHRVKANTTTVITSDTPEPSVVGQTVTVTSTVTSGAGTPTGSVTVNDGAEASCVANLSNGSGSCTLTPTSAGNKTLTATYGGDIDFNGSSDTEPHQVNQADTTTTIISDTPEPSVVGQSVTVQYSVTVDSPGSGTPTGQVTVSDGAGASCTDTVAAGSCTLTPTSAGDKTLTAIYEGDDKFMSSSDTEPHQVNRADSTTAISTHNPDPSVVGQAVVVSYTLTANPPGGGMPTGDVTVSDGDGNSCVATVAAGGCVLTSTIAGSKTLTATYG
ncbi:MAG: Ig-like domain repeat protein, partial [Anaerolineae bacterium]|nr:Ig-like domain repeat protein [Anaerolineae bacterium]